jgi:K+-transporting ATPase ATPase A chain
LAAYVAILLLAAKPLGTYMARVFAGERTWLARVLGPLERLTYRVAGVDPDSEMSWVRYATAAILSDALGLAVVYALQRFQAVPALNPQGFGGVTPDSSLNTAVSFATNTDRQGYGGETTSSYLTRMLGPTVQNFVYAATGIAVLVAPIRGFTRQNAQGVGNFRADLVRSTLYVLAPLALVPALALMSQGVVQTFSPHREVPLLQAHEHDLPKLDAQGAPVLDPQGNALTGTKVQNRRPIAVGPATSQVAIKPLGTDGGFLVRTGDNGHDRGEVFAAGAGSYRCAAARKGFRGKDALLTPSRGRCRAGFARAAMPHLR